jgi:hypothetical protein
MADAITEACEAIGKAAESQQVMVYGPAVSFAGNHLVLRWSSDFPSLAKDVLRKLLPSDSRKPASRFHAVDTSPEAAARGYAECIDVEPRPKADFPPEFSEPVVANPNIVHNEVWVDPADVRVFDPTALAASIDGELLAPVLPALVPGESLKEPVAFADPGPLGDVGPGYLARNDEQNRASAAQPVDCAAQARAATTSDGVALSRNMPVKVAIDGQEPASGIVQAGPRGMLVVKGVVRVKLDDGQTVFARPEALTASKE